MEIRKVGNSGLAVSVLGLGCNNFGMRIGAEETLTVVEAALEAGITLFDTAEMYGGGKSEEFLGAALAKSGKRDDVIIASKFGRAGQGGSRSEIIRSCERSLQRLGTDYIDLYYQHYVDRTTPIDETLAALTQLVEQGKVRYLGSSNVDSWHVAEADHTAREQHLRAVRRLPDGVECAQPRDRGGGRPGLPPVRARRHLVLPAGVGSAQR